MKVKLLALLFLAASFVAHAQEAKPLRVFIRGGAKTHGPNQHDHPRFLQDWTRLLNERGAKADGGMEFPTAAQLENTDVVVVYAADGMKVTGQERANFEKYLQRGGGLVVIHDGVVSADQHEWAKKVQGGAWIWNDPSQPNKKTKWYEGEVGIYFVNLEHPITQGISNFDWKDEIYHDLDMAPDARILATSFHSVFVIAPQLWTYEKTWEGGTQPYRSFVSLPGHEYDVFNTPHYRSILLRGIAWAGKRPNADEFCKPEELAALKYPQGGPTAPEKAVERFNVHPDFSINLVAAEPLIEKVISLDWDEKGRLWVAETPEYPGGRTINKNDKMVALWNVANPEQTPSGNKQDRAPKDRISWLEDTNGDGRMDKKTVFHDGLELVTSLVFYKDGVIVGQAPDILWIRDTNGDGKSDKVEKLYTGFGTGDTHAVINNFRWGMDGWVYSAIGYSAGNPSSGDGSKAFGRVTAGIIRFRPDGSALEQYASGSCNTWGFDFGPDGEAFYTTATCGEHFLHVVMPEKVLARGNVGGVRSSAVLPDHQKVFPSVHHTRPAYIQIDLVGGFTAAAGCAIYNGGAWPAEYNGSHFCSETTVSLVHHEVLKPKGVSYTASKAPGREEAEFVAANDLWFRPIHTRIGPDGALYIVDFYNQAAIHNDTRGPAHGAHNAATRPDRDHHFGRIWRVQHKQSKNTPRPAFADKNTAALVRGLASENGWARQTSVRILSENGADDQLAAIKDMAGKTSFKPEARIAALYTLANLDELDGPLFHAAVHDNDPIVRRNALRLLAERDNSGAPLDIKDVRARINDSDPRARLNSLIALSTFDLSPEVAQAVVAAWPTLNDKHLESAAVGVAAKDPLLFVDAACNASAPEGVASFMGHITRQIANRQDAALAAKLVILLAKEPEQVDALKQAALETLASTLRANVIPQWTPELQSAFKTLLNSKRAGLPGATLPLIARWDANNSFGAELRPVVAQLSGTLGDSSLPDDQRGQVAVNLLGVRKVDPSIVPAVGKLIGSSASASLQRRVIDALGATGDAEAASILIGALTRLPNDLQETALGQLIKRADWSQQLVQAIGDQKVNLVILGPSGMHRLRTHSDKAVAAKANAVIDALRGPEQKEKDKLIEEFKAVVEKPGANIANGKTLFTANCASCHKFKGEGVDLAPDLTGMGAHGAAELLVHIVDPNRLVEPNFVSVSVETKDELSYDGVIARENQAELVLRNAGGDFVIRKDNIQSRRSTGLSLMPNGFEALGGEGLRDLLAYICADENKFRILDLSSVFTGSSSRGIYNSPEQRDETLRFRKTGLVKVDDVPFEVVSTARTQTGNNILVLKGGMGHAKTYPKQIELKAGFAATQLHFLGGVGGWGYPFGGDNKNEGMPVVKVTLHFADKTTEEIVLKNGVEFADYIGSANVPGSKNVPDLVQRGQVRSFSKPVKGKGVIDKITVESYDTIVAPTFVAITAELSPESRSASAH